MRAAADALFLTQPALTKSIARIEDELGVKLFDRRGRKLVLTEIGERLVMRGREMLRNATDINEEVDSWLGLGFGAVAIGVDAESELDRLPKVLASFVPNYPNVQLTVRSGYVEDLLNTLQAGELHFLIADPELALDHQDLDVTLLHSDPIVPAVRKGHPLMKRRKPKPEEFAQFPLAGASTAPRFVQWKEQRGLSEVGRAFVPSLLCDNYEVLISLAEHSDTIIFGPRHLMTTYEGQSRIKVMPWDTDGPEIQYSVIRTRNRTLSPAAEHLIALCQNTSRES